MATARKSGASACSSSSIIAELCWLMCVIITAGPVPEEGPAARQWMCPAKVFARPRSIGNAMLLELHAGELDDLGPLGALEAQEGRELLRCAADGNAARGGKGADHFLAVQGLDRGRVNLLAMGEQRLARRDQRVPVVGVDLGQAELAHGRHVGQQ